MKKNMPALLKITLATALLVAASPALLQQASVYAQTESSDFEIKLAPLKIQIEDQLLEVPGGKSVDGDTYVGLAFLSQKLGLTTAWDEATKTVTVSAPNKKMSMMNQSTQYSMNGREFFKPLPPVIVDGTTYLPLRLLLEQMGYQIGYNDQNHVVSITKIQENELTLTNKSDSKKITDNQNITIDYPQIEGWANSAASAKINTFIQSEIEKYKDAANKELSKSGNEYPYSMDVNYQITYNQKHKLSLYFEVYTFTGGAHGFTTHDAHTFDLDTGNELSLQQVTSTNTNYKTIINQEIKKQLKERQLESDLLEPFESIRDDQGFYLKDDTVVVYFGLYEYVPYVMGILGFPIPLSAFAAVK
ncbi:stalk domain-containing protein [Paenibacillus sp. HWE-109]|uniref:stalk domain-containing protein n=1 Tax=Paenibacillus sp. HWE-109 TaxID=1306526 RepID=UPI001EDF076C|nr:stalk domain-containing protein [Paenibacillus sp. HWE-109]UKS26566.1 stalk domain-containing protein [Paenibacillus sp. HWE-109]